MTTLEPPREIRLIEPNGRERTTRLLTGMLQRLERRLAGRGDDDSDPLAGVPLCLAAPAVRYETQRRACESAADARLLSTYRRAISTDGVSFIELRADVSDRLYALARMQWPSEGVRLLETCTNCTTLYLCYDDAGDGLPAVRGRCMICASQPLLTGYRAMAEALPTAE